MQIRFSASWKWKYGISISSNLPRNLVESVPTKKISYLDCIISSSGTFFPNYFKLWSHTEFLLRDVSCNMKTYSLCIDSKLSPTKPMTCNASSWTDHSLHNAQSACKSWVSWVCKGNIGIVSATRIKPYFANTSFKFLYALQLFFEGLDLFYKSHSQFYFNSHSRNFCSVMSRRSCPVIFALQNIAKFIPIELEVLFFQVKDKGPVLNQIRLMFRFNWCHSEYLYVAYGQIG